MNVTQVKAVWIQAIGVFDRCPLPTDPNERETVWKIYASATRDVDFNLAMHFIDWWIANGNWWPKPGDLRSWIIDQADGYDVDSVFHELLIWLRETYVRSSRFNNIEPWPELPQDLRPIATVYGGFAQMWPHHEDEFWRKEVKRSLESVALKRRRIAELPGTHVFAEIQANLSERIALASTQYHALEAKS